METLDKYNSDSNNYTSSTYSLPISKLSESYDNEELYNNKMNTRESRIIETKYSIDEHHPSNQLVKRARCSIKHNQLITIINTNNQSTISSTA